MQNHGPTGSPEKEITILMAEVMRRILSDFRKQLLSEIRMALHEKFNPPQKKWLKSADVKKLLGISHGTLQTLRNNGRLPFTRIGGVIYYPLEELEKMFHTRQPPSH